jgi:hypothetical protein
MVVLQYILAIIGGTYMYDKPAFFGLLGAMILVVVVMVAFFRIKDKRAKR